MTEPGGQDPNEKYMFDEITINGIGSPSCVPFAVNYGTGLAGQNGIPTFTASAPPKFGTTINLMVSNSSGAVTAGLLIVGTSSASIPFLGGTLLAVPLLTVSVPVPANGLVLSVAVPGNTCLSLCAQVLLRDAAATNGVSMTPGLQLDLGN